MWKERVEELWRMGRRLDKPGPCHLSQAETLQCLGESVLKTAETLPDVALTPAAERDAAAAAGRHFEAAASAYACVRPAGAPPTTPPRVDACVNLGNTLCAWAGVVAGAGGGGGDGARAATAEAGSLVQRALDAYGAALAQEEDASVWAVG